MNVLCLRPPSVHVRLLSRLSSHGQLHRNLGGVGSTRVVYARPSFVRSLPVQTFASSQAVRGSGVSGNMGDSIKFIDIGANLTDSMYQGEYHGKQAHDGDMDAVLNRAWAAGVERVMVTAGQLSEVKEVGTAPDNDQYPCA
eukprot:5740112-Pyramimonas_sp.AAC.2